MGTKKRVYGQDPYMILDLFGDIGGILELLTTIGLLISSSYVKHSYQRSIIQNNYQVQKYTDTQSEYYQSNKVNEYAMKAMSTNQLDECPRLTSEEESSDNDSSDSHSQSNGDVAIDSK